MRYELTGAGLLAGIFGRRIRGMVDTEAESLARRLG